MRKVTADVKGNLIVLTLARAERGERRACPRRSGQTQPRERLRLDGTGNGERRSGDRRAVGR
jgi:hypothetical protein